MAIEQEVSYNFDFIKLANGRAINKYSSKTDHYKSFSSTVKQANGRAIHKYVSEMAVGGAICKYGSKTGHWKSPTQIWL